MTKGGSEQTKGKICRCLIMRVSATTVKTWGRNIIETRHNTFVVSTTHLTSTLCSPSKTLIPAWIPSSISRSLAFLFSLVSAPMQTIHIQRPNIPVVHVDHAVEVTRRPAAHGMSPERWIFSGVATGEHASFPGATYLRKRYKKLQRCIVSRMPSSSPPSASQRAGAVEISESYSSPGGFNPSFQAIRFLNRQSESQTDPYVINAIIKDFNGNIVGTNLSAAPTSETLAQDTQDRLESSSRNLQSFGTRVERLIKAIHRRQRIQYGLSESGENVDVFASNANGSETGSPRSVTHQIAAFPNIIGRIISPRSESVSQSPDSPGSIDRFFCPRSFPSREHGSTQPLRATNPVLNDRILARVRVGSTIITENQRRELSERIRDRIAASAGRSIGASGKIVVRRGNCGDDDGSAATDSYNQLETIDPTKLYVIRQSGKEECHTVSPIRLDYLRGRGFATPSLSGSSGSSLEPSPHLADKSMKPHRSVRRIGYPANSPLLTSPVATTDARVSDETDQGPSREQDGEDSPLEREQKSKRVFSWLHRVKDALMKPEDSPSKKVARAVNIFREGPVRTSGQSAENDTPGPAKALKDVTNMRQPDIFHSNSSKQKRIRLENLLAKSKNQKKQRVAPTEPATLHDALDDSTKATVGSEESNGSTVKQVEEDLHPEVEYSLGRLEGRMQPRPSSPVQIRRSIDDTSLYGSDVELELLPSGLANPQPLRPDHESVVGNWTAPLEEAVEAGFECLLEPPEEV